MSNTYVSPMLGNIPLNTLDAASLEDAFFRAKELADEARCGFGLLRQDAITLRMAMLAERAESVEAELAAVKRELAGAKLLVARLQKRVTTSQEQS